MDRKTEIYGLIRWEELLLGELRYKNGTLEQCVRGTIPYTEGILRIMLEAIVENCNRGEEFRTSFLSEVDGYLAKAGLGKNLSTGVRRLFDTDSFCDKEMQIATISHNKQILENEYAKVLREIDEKLKLVKSLSFLFGILLIVLLL